MKAKKETRKHTSANDGDEKVRTFVEILGKAGAAETAKAPKFLPNWHRITNTNS